MSDIGLSYDASVQPSSLGVRIGLGFNNNVLRASIRDIDNFVIVLKPSGNVGEQILSGVAWPLAQFLGVVLPTIARNLIGQQSFDVLTVSPTTKTVMGETISLTPHAMRASSHGGMLLVQTAVDVA